MAKIDKVKGYRVERLLKHNNRTEKTAEAVRSNPDIHLDRTADNYHIREGNYEQFKKRLSEVFNIPSNDQVVMVEVVVTLPKDVRKGDERNFFQAVYDFYVGDFGQENIINAVIHRDEKTPHLHLDFVPVIKGDPIRVDKQTGEEIKLFQRRGKKMFERWKEEHPNQEFERLCCCDLINQEYFDNMHPRLSNYVEGQLGYQVEIMNGATDKGDLSVARLKAGSLKKEIEELTIKKEQLKEDVLQIAEQVKHHNMTTDDIGLLPLMQRIADLENQNRVLQSIITRNKYSFKREDAENLRLHRYTPSKSSAVNVFEGSLATAEIDKNAVIVVELYQEKPRPSPQQRLIDKDDDLYRQAKLVQSSSVKVMFRNSRTTDRLYLFIKTDNERQTIDTLLEMERKLKETDLKGRRLYMDKIESDKYEIARTILSNLNIPTIYFATPDMFDEAKVKEKDISK